MTMLIGNGDGSAIHQDVNAINPVTCGRLMLMLMVWECLWQCLWYW